MTIIETIRNTLNLELFQATYYGNTIYNWTIALGIILGAFILGKIVYWIIKNIIKKLTAKTKTKLDDIIVDQIEEPALLAIILFGIWYAMSILIFSESTDNTIQKIYHVLITINITWLISRLFQSAYEEYILPLAEKTETDFDDQILPLIRKGIKIVIWTLGIIVALDNAGYKIGPLLAGLGIGGIALAMAAKDTIANIFGGFTIFTDKPFVIKDRIKIDSYDGFVEEIGLRSTRLRTLQGTQVTIPNSHFSENPVENVEREPNRKIILNLGLTYDTTPENMKKAIKILNNIATKNNDVTKGFKISFNAFGDFSLGIMFIYYIKKRSNILQTQNDINMEILSQYNKENLSFAFPTQTIELMK